MSKPRIGRKKEIRKVDPDVLKEIIKMTPKERAYLLGRKNMFPYFFTYYFVDYIDYPFADFHYDFFKDVEGLLDGKIYEAAWIAFRESAKRQPLTAKLMTPQGYRTMGELKEGDYVIGADGKPTRIILMTDVVTRPTYRITTEDGRTTECDAEHLWEVRKMTNVKEKNVVMTTQEIMDSGLGYIRKPDKRNGRAYTEWKYAIDTVKAVELEEREQPVEPYYLGLWLGDGTKGTPNITTADEEVMDYLKEYAERLGLNYRQIKEKSKAYKITITGERGSGNSLQAKLKEIGVLENKHIPEDYLYGSIEQRKALLEGLMDSDGTVNSGTASFCNTNEDIVDGVVSLVRSLGGRAIKTAQTTHCTYDDEVKDCDSWRVSIVFTDYTPFRLERKKKLHKLSNHTFSRIVDITPVGNKAGRCIKVEDSRELYVTDDYLLTHNTSITKGFIIYMLTYKKRHYINVDSYSKENAERILFDVVLELQTNKRIIEDFGQLYNSKRQQNEEVTQKKISNFVTNNGIRVEAHSTQEPVRGRLSRNHRPDAVILDDFETNKTIASELITMNIREHIGEFQGGLASNAFVLYLGNYLSEYGNVQWIIDRGEVDEKIRVRMVPLYDDNENLTWPEKYAMTDKEAKAQGKVSVERVRKRLSSPQEGDRRFQMEMLNKPVDPSKQVFKKDMFKHITWDELQKKRTSCFITFDTAVSQEEGSDDTGITINWVDSEGTWHLKSWGEKLTPTKVMDLIFGLYIQYKPDKIGIEKGVYSMTIKPFLQEEMRKRNLYPNVVEIDHHNKRKTERIEWLLPRYEAGAIFHLQGECEKLELQLLKHPSTIHDDVADSASMQTQIATAPMAAEVDYSEIVDGNLYDDIGL